MGAEHDGGTALPERGVRKSVFAPGPLLKGVQRSSERGRGKNVAGSLEAQKTDPGGQSGRVEMAPLR